MAFQVSMEFYTAIFFKFIAKLLYVGNFSINQMYVKDLEFF